MKTKPIKTQAIERQETASNWIAAFRDYLRWRAGDEI